mgnify:CR=1 FL=1
MTNSVLIRNTVALALQLIIMAGGLPGWDGSDNSDESSDRENTDGETGGQEPGEMETDDAFGAEDENASAGDSGGQETEESLVADRMNQENVILSADDVEDIELFVSGITGVTISYSTRGSVEGGSLNDDRPCLP